MRKILICLAVAAVVFGMAGGAQAYSTTQNFNLQSPGVSWNNPYDATSNPYPAYVYSFTDDVTSTHFVQSNAPGTATPLLYLFDNVHTPGFSATNVTTWTGYQAYAVGTVGGVASLTYGLTAGTKYWLVATETNFGGQPIKGGGTLSVRTVPIPGAFWLFAPGLAGLAGFGRKCLG